jgi:uncharacterized protein (TIGR00369 family)
MNNEHYRKLENLMHSAPIVQLTGARVHIEKGKAEIFLPVKKKLHHAANALHGAMYFLALDNAAFFAVNSLVEDVFLLTTSFTLYLERPVIDGYVKAVGNVVMSSSSQYIAEAILYDSQNQEVARGSGIFVKSRIPLTPQIGYV